MLLCLRYTPRMCGIAGIVHLDGAPIDPTALDRLTDALAHRGPDGRGTAIAGSVGLGHRRLKILDLSDAAWQPMRTEDSSLTLTFNGEIYNFQDLRRDLVSRGYTFRSTGDTEVLLRMYEVYGEDCVRHLRGMFAFAIHDRKRNTLFLARDRVGKKPLKYFLSGRTFAFASELKALQALEQCPRGMDAEAVHHYLTMMYVHAPRTGITGISKLPAAHTLTIDLSSGTMQCKRYWQSTYESDSTVTEQEWKERILTVLRESTALRMVADVPVGAFLSGGIDSAAVVALMSQCTDRPIETFSIGSPEESHNELPDAERIARHFSTNHHPIVLEPDIVHLLPEIVRTYEEPFADPSTIPTFLLARETRKHVTVALNGDGGDENFAGYVRYPILRFSEYWRRLPVHALARPFVSLLHAVGCTTLTYRMQRFEETIRSPWPERLLQYLSFFTEQEKQELYRSDFATSFPSTASWYKERTEGARCRADDLLHQALSMDLETYLADDLLPKVDLGSMAHGLEARSPFLDHTLLELTARIPSRYALTRRGVGKWILKESFRDILPPETLQKRKSGFRLPLDAWFRGDLKPFVTDRLLSVSSPLGTIFKREALDTFLHTYFRQGIDRSDHVWSLLWLDEWMRQYT